MVTSNASLCTNLLRSLNNVPIVTLWLFNSSLSVLAYHLFSIMKSMFAMNSIIEKQNKNWLYSADARVSNKFIDAKRLQDNAKFGIRLG